MCTHAFILVGQQNYDSTRPQNAEDYLDFCILFSYCSLNITRLDVDSVSDLIRTHENYLCEYGNVVSIFCWCEGDINDTEEFNINDPSVCTQRRAR